MDKQDNIPENRQGASEKSAQEKSAQGTSEKSAQETGAQGASEKSAQETGAQGASDKGKKRKKINLMSLKEIEAKLKDVQDKMGNLKSRYAKQLLKQKQSLETEGK